MWKKLFSGLGSAAAPPAQPPGDDDNDNEGEDEEGELEDFNDEFLDMEEDEYSWLCRACMKPIRGLDQSISEPYEDSQGFRVHQRCLHCCICRTILESTLLAGAEQWRINIIPAPEPPPEDPLQAFASLRDLLAPLVQRDLLRDPIDKVVAEFEKAGVTGEEWRNRLYQVSIDKPYYRMALSKTTLAAINQAVYPREGPVPVEPAETAASLTAKLRTTSNNASAFVRHVLNFMAENILPSGVPRLPPTHPYCESLLKLSRFALFLARQIHAKVVAKSDLVAADLEDVRSLEVHIVSIKALITAQERTKEVLSAEAQAVLETGGRDIQGAAHTLLPEAERYVGILPRDICKIVLGNLDFTTLLRCRFVSRFWKSVADEDTLWCNLFRRQWGTYKLLHHTWKQAFIEMYKEMNPISDDKRIVRTLLLGKETEIVQKWNELGLPRMYRPVPASAVPGVPHPLSTSALTFDLRITMQGILDFADLELGSRACETSGCLRDKRVALHMLMRYAKFMHLRTLYPDASLIPTDDIALVWASHMIRPHLYEADCKKLYGGIVLHAAMTDRALDVLFWSGLKQTEELWHKHYSSDYSLRPAGYVHEAQDNAAYRMHVAEQGRALPPPEPGYYENFATGGKAQDDPEVNEILESTNKEIANEPEWQNPFSLTVEDLLADRLWGAHFERFTRILRVVPFCAVNASISAKALKNYEKFLYLQLKFPTVQLVPNYLIQLAIRAHMFDPIGYREDMLRLFGKVLAPLPCPTGEQLLAYQRTRELWKEEYGTELDAEALNSQLNDEKATRSEIETEIEYTLTETDPEDLCSVFIKRSVPVLPSVLVALDNNFCTYSATGLDFANQNYYHCESCIDEGKFAEDEGICATCARVCHLGHELSEEVTDRPFFCDCGPSGHCHCLAPEGWKPPIIAAPSKESPEDEDEDVDAEPHVEPLSILP